MRKTTTCFFAALMFLIANAAFSQTVSGRVVESGTNTPLSGASVKLVGSSAGTTTDAEGRFSITASPDGQLEISYVGYETQIVAINNKTELTISLISLSSLLTDVVVSTGARSSARTLTTTPLPVDVFSSTDLISTGQPTFDKALQYRVPSFNTVNTPVNDATTLLDPYEIRNLGPSRTLILINGKRKNLSSLLYVQFSPGRGETGADLAAIPPDAIKRVEIVRDGASAQYGSDAIAGVMNVILKDRIQYNTLILRGGITSQGDGENYGLAYNGGSDLARNGFINYTIDFSQQNSALRSGDVDLTTEIATFGNPNESPTHPDNIAITNYLKLYPDANNKNGSGEITAAKFNFNLGLPVGLTGNFYSNAGYVAKKANSNANFRPSYWKQDYGLLHPAGSTYIGYQPTFEGDLIDYHATIGLKNEIDGWKHDISFTTGGNQQLYSVNNTVNHSLKEASTTSFKPGGYNFSHVVGNYDVSKSLFENFSLAFGSEIRKETYKIIAGDTASYSGEGANSFPGIRQENAGTNSRYNFGAYIDASWDISKDFLLNGAVRGEKYSDFGKAFVWKASSRYKFAGDKAVIRASASTGFRAPTLHQIYAQSTQASFVSGTIQLSGLFNNRSKQAFALGVPLLKPEKSNNYTVGLGFSPNRNLNITFDYYNITIKDRIVYSSSIASDDPTTDLYQILQEAGVVNIQFFINGIKTRTEGIDLVGNYRNIALGNGKLGVNIAGNYTLNNEILGSPNDPQYIKDAGATILSTQIKSLLTKSRPKYKAVLGLDYAINKFNINLNNTLFGPTEFQDLENGGSDMENIVQKFSTAVVTDLNLGYDFTNRLSASISANNLFNILPKWKLEALNSDGQAVLSDATARQLLEGFLAFSGRYKILAYNGSQFSQLGTTFNATLTFRF
jgi:iron complex outermembrane receptor protein